MMIFTIITNITYIITLKYNFIAVNISPYPPDLTNRYACPSSTL